MNAKPKRPASVRERSDRMDAIVLAIVVPFVVVVALTVVVLDIIAGGIS